MWRESWATGLRNAVLGAVVLAGGCEPNRETAAVAPRPPDVAAKPVRERSGDAEADAGQARQQNRNSESGAARAGTLDTAETKDIAVRVLQLAPWPGGGLRVLAELLDGRGRPLTELDAVSMEIETQSGERHGMATAHHKVSSGLTGLVLVPSPDEEAHQQRIEAAQALLEALPEGELIGLWAATERLSLLADLTTRHDHIRRRLRQLKAAKGTASAASSSVMLRDRLGEIAGRWSMPSRFLVVVHGGEATFNVNSHPVGLLQLDAQAETTLTSDGRVGWSTQGDPAVAGEALAKHISDRRVSLVSAGTCAHYLAGSRVTLVAGSARQMLSTPAPEAHMRHVSCSAEAAARDQYPFGDTVKLWLTDAELADWRTYAEREVDSEFTLRIQLGDSAPIPARVHFRGHSSIKCERKSLNLDLKDGRPRRLTRSAESDELLLISLCRDRQYFRQRLAQRLLGELGLFPLESRYVRLQRNDEDLGVYLLLQKPTHTLRRALTNLKAVVRRRNDALHEDSEIKFVNDAADETVATKNYEQLMSRAETLPARELYAGLGERMDIDGYLRWLAFHTYLQTADYADEVFFYASAEGSGEEPAWYFRPLAWDSDDLLSDCHLNGAYAHADPYGILYCSESDLDHALLRSDDVYARFITELEWLMDDQMAPGRLERHLLEVRDELLPLFEDRSTCAAMVELLQETPEANDCAVAGKTIRAAMDDLLH
ncbi:CotH kinase family protein, partial [Myxococcota bacterium]